MTHKSDEEIIDESLKETFDEATLDLCKTCNTMKNCISGVCGRCRKDTKSVSNEDWRKTHAPCRVCDKQAVGCFSPDLDIVGLCYCDEHQIEVMQEYMMIIQGVREKDTPN